MAMAVARYLVASCAIESSPGLRRSKQIDGFRERPGEVHVPVLLDDPNLAGINLEDSKSFLDVGEAPWLMHGIGKPNSLETKCVSC